MTPEEKDAALRVIRSCAEDIIRVGSRVTCDPPPTDTDDDRLVLIRPGPASWGFFKWLEDTGWTRGGYGGAWAPPDEVFWAYRKGDLNLIITTSREFWSRFRAASDTAKHLNLLDKGARVALFQAVLYGRSPMIGDGFNARF